ncbi:imidazole glycerol phosphate synthase subunit HisH [Conchiformibius kuhniae]|uniref:Imidazole glycerol phosphate synthase subunit HisH n=1 Tax=Conchiformibius kuhniae TaxID=211502 RepID=A0A8T9MWA1_9NEIS|nr:imidazole glycerol phosphate synthase subunit HisH [Conchiformibius kuhniae]UOP04462.1 imidazole glycerol phosphate synthase subunit HisH [Conchiformibius kuhniae]
MKIAIVDYGMGNLHSVLKSVQAAARLARTAADIALTDRPEALAAADKIVFPGQGAMPDCMAALQRNGLDEALSHALRHKPFFGICVGAQLLFERSEEGDTAGLGHFRGTVKRFAHGQRDPHGTRLKIPHMGWNSVRQTRPHPMFADIANGTRFYFVHSYHFAPAEPQTVAGESDYPDPFACIVARDNVFATQFHTEKSHDAGLLMLRNFLNWQP